MIEEKWRQHPIYTDHEVSNLGRVRRYLKPFKMSNGYPHVSLGGVKKRDYVHSLVMEAFVGPLPIGQVTRHLDGDKNNNALSNLCYGTYEENMADRKLHGGGNHGSRHGLSKLTEEQVREIRGKISLGWKTDYVASEYGVSRRLIGMIAQGRRWKHVGA